MLVCIWSVRGLCRVEPWNHGTRNSTADDWPTREGASATVALVCWMYENSKILPYCLRPGGDRWLMNQFRSELKQQRRETIYEMTYKSSDWGPEAEAVYCLPVIRNGFPGLQWQMLRNESKDFNSNRQSHNKIRRRTWIDSGIKLCVFLAMNHSHTC